MPNFRHGKSAVISMKIGGSTAYVKMSTHCDDSELKRMVDTAEVTTYQNSDKTYLAGLRGAEFTFNAHFASTMYARVAGQLGASTNPSFRYGPENNTTGRARYNFDGVITGLNLKGPVGDKVAYDVSVQISGAVTSTTWTSTD